MFNCLCQKNYLKIIDASPKYRSLLLGMLAATVGMWMSSCASSSTDTSFPEPQTIKSVSARINPVGPRTFGVGDRLELLVEEDPSFNGQYEVRSEGYVLIPKLGRVPVRGLTRQGAETRVKEFLQRSQLKNATVFVEMIAQGTEIPDAVGGGADSTMNIRVFVTGKVARPGQHVVPLTAASSTPGIYEVLLMTGGAMNFGNLDKVQILRLDSSGKRKTQVVNVRKIQKGELPDVPVGDGDIIHVPEKVFGF